MIRILTVASALFLESPASGDIPATMPAGVASELLESEGLLEFAKGCAEERSLSDLDGALLAAETQQFELRRRTILIWGGGSELATRRAIILPLQRRCGRKNLEDALAVLAKMTTASESDLAAYETLLSKGAWLGPIKLCHKTVAAVVAGIDTFRDTPTVLVEMTGKGAERLAEFTERAVLDEVAIRVDGVVVSTPRVHEPMLSGKFQISAPEDQALIESMRSIATAPC